MTESLGCRSWSHSRGEAHLSGDYLSLFTAPHEGWNRFIIPASRGVSRTMKSFYSRAGSNRLTRRRGMGDGDRTGSANQD